MKGKEGSGNYPVLNIWLRFQFLKGGLFSLPCTLRNAGVFVSGSPNTIYAPPIGPARLVSPGQTQEAISCCYFLHGPLKQPEEFADYCDSYPLWGQGSVFLPLEHGKNVLNNLPRKYTRFCIKCQGFPEPPPPPCPLMQSRRNTPHLVGQGAGDGDDPV